MLSPPCFRPGRAAFLGFRVVKKRLSGGRVFAAVLLGRAIHRSGGADAVKKPLYIWQYIAHDAKDAKSACHQDSPIYSSVEFLREKDVFYSSFLFICACPPIRHWKSLLWSGTVDIITYLADIWLCTDKKEEDIIKLHNCFIHTFDTWDKIDIYGLVQAFWKREIAKFNRLLCRTWSMEWMVWCTIEVDKMRRIVVGGISMRVCMKKFTSTYRILKSLY